MGKIDISVFPHIRRKDLAAFFTRTFRPSGPEDFCGEIEFSRFSPVDLVVPTWTPKK